MIYNLYSIPVECQKILTVNIPEICWGSFKTIDIIFILYYTVILFHITTLVQQFCHSNRRKYKRMMRGLLLKENYLIKQFIELTNQSF